MELTIVGSGNVGMALGRAWKKAGHAVTFAVRNASAAKAENLKKNGFHAAAMSEAGKQAKVILLAVPWHEAENALRSLGDLSGKIVIDATNPLTKELELGVGFSNSAGETVAKLCHGARVVKAFNTTGAENMDRAGEFPVRPAMLVASDDMEAKKTVQKLASDIGFEPVDAGPLSASRLLEPIAMQWIKLAFGGMGTSFAFAIVRR
jgi:predicted dinucleotide-binding enzyme